MGVRRIRVALSVAVASLALAACGSSNGTGAAASSGATGPDPAARVPSNVALYISAIVRPSTTEAAAITHVIDLFGGTGATTRLVKRLEQRVGSRTHGGSYNRDVAPWLGDQAALVITAWPADPSNTSQLSPKLALILPTEHPDLARQKLQGLEHGAPHNLTWKVVGDYVLLGGRPAVAELARTSASNSLAADPQWKSDIAQFGPGPFATAHLSTSRFATLIERAMDAGGGNHALDSRLLGAVASGAAVNMALSVDRSEVTLDAITDGTSTTGSEPVSVSSVPAGSWLAVGIPAVSGKRLRFSLSNLQTASGRNSEAAKGFDVLEGTFPELMSGFGPATLSVAGSKSLQAGLRVTMPTSQDASELVHQAHSLLALSDKRVSGGDDLFTIALSATQTLTVGDSGNQVVATTGYPDQRDFTRPSSKLSDTKLYEQAVDQLPPGSSVPLFIDFDSFTGSALARRLESHPGDARLRATLRKLSYLIAGRSGKHERIVLGLH